MKLTGKSKKHNSKRRFLAEIGHPTSRRLLSRVIFVIAWALRGGIWNLSFRSIACSSILPFRILGEETLLLFPSARGDELFSRNQRDSRRIVRVMAVTVNMTHQYISVPTGEVFDDTNCGGAQQMGWWSWIVAMFSRLFVLRTEVWQLALEFCLIAHTY